MGERFGFVVSPHGFGHAARTVAVIEAWREVRPDLEPHLFTAVPEWFFEDALAAPFGYHRHRTDVGLVQRSAVEEDPRATAAALDELRPFERAARPLAEELRRLGCRLVVCDISPLGIAAARLAGIPAVLVENFTWDWIYRPYFADEPRLETIAGEMAALFADVDLHVQAEPVCHARPTAHRVPPVHRRTRGSPAETRSRLHIESDRPLVLLTMGGLSWRYDFLDRLAGRKEAFVVFAGVDRLERRGNLLLLPDRSPIYLPDLIAAADAIVGKLGYSTVAEALAAGTRYLFVPRPRFPESPVLERFVLDRLPSAAVSLAGFIDGAWTDHLDELLARPRPAPLKQNGADRIITLLDRLALL